PPASWRCLGGTSLPAPKNAALPARWHKRGRRASRSVGLFGTPGKNGATENQNEAKSPGETRRNLAAAWRVLSLRNPGRGFDDAADAPGQPRFFEVSLRDPCHRPPRRQPEWQEPGGSGNPHWMQAPGPNRRQRRNGPDFHEGRRNHTVRTRDYSNCAS